MEKGIGAQVGQKSGWVDELHDESDGLTGFGVDSAAGSNVFGDLGDSLDDKVEHVTQKSDVAEDTPDVKPVLADEGENNLCTISE